MKTLEKIIIGAVVFVGVSLLAQQCSKSVIELKHNLLPRSYSTNYEPESIKSTDEQRGYQAKVNTFYQH